MTARIPEFRHDRPKRLAQLMRFAWAAVSGSLLFIPSAFAGTTGCWATLPAPYTNQLITPDIAPNVECPSFPCAANYDGPMTQCILNGEDPPISSPMWDEPIQGNNSNTTVLLNTSCGPARTGALIGTGATDGYESQNGNVVPGAACGMNSDGTAKKCLPILNCPPMSSTGFTIPLNVTR